MADLVIALGNTSRSISYSSTTSGGGLTVSQAGIGDYYRVTVDRSSTVSSVGPLTTTSGTIPQWTSSLPAASGSTSTSVVYIVQGSDDGVAWTDTDETFTLIRNAIPAPSSLNFSYPSTASSTVTVTMSATGGSGSYEYSSDNSNWSISNTFTGTRGQTYTRYVRSTFGGLGSNSIQNSVLVEFLLPPATITTTAPSSTIAYNAGSQTNTVTDAGQTSGTGVYYRLLKDGADNVGEFNPATQTLPRAVDIATTTELPPPNTSSSYQWQCIRFTGAGGDGLYDDCQGTGSSFTITRQNVPAPNTPTATPSTEGDANPSVTVSATGGVGVTYNITAGATTPSTGWGAGPFTATSDTSATLTRGQTYYIWARSNYTYNAVNYTNAVSTTYNVPYLDPQYPSAVFPTAINVFFGETSFTIDIFNGETSTSDNTFQIRTGSYTGTIVGTGGAILNETVTITVNDTVGVNLGDTETYYITAYRSAGTGGSGGVTVANVTTFTATTIITTPVVNDSQNLTSTEEDDIIDHTIAMTSLGGGGTLQYAISTSATYNVNIVRTWQSSPSFTGANGIERGTAYYFWARRADSATYADSAGPFTADFLLPYLGLTAETPPANIAFDDTASYDFNVLTVNGGAAPPPGASPAVGHYYRLMRTTGDPDDQVGFYDPNTTPNKLITLSYPAELPPEGTTWNYQWQVRRFNGAGGPLTAEYYDCTGTGSSFSVTRASGDTIPDQFTFTDAGRVLKNTLITSTAITVTGISAAATIGVTGSGGTNHAYEINNSGNWLTTNSTVTNGATVKVRHTSSTSDNTAANTTLDIGGVTDTFTSTTYRMPIYNLGNITLDAVTTTSKTLGSNDASDVTVGWTSPDSFAQYRITRLDFDPINNPTPTTIVSQNLTVGASSTLLDFVGGPYGNTPLPSDGYTGSYRIQIRVPTGQGGNEVWYAARRPDNSLASFTISRIAPPVVLDGQPFDRYTNSSTITHAIALATAGAHGTLQYAVSTSSTYNASLVYSWTTNNAFVLTRGNSYYLWARRADNIFDSDRSNALEVVPPVSVDYGIAVYNSSGTRIFDTSSRIARSEIASGTITISAASWSSYVSGITLDNENIAHVVVTAPALANPANYPTTVALFEVEVNYAPTNTFRIKNNAAVSLTYSYYVFKTG